MDLYSDTLTANDVWQAFSDARTGHGADIWVDRDYGPGCRDFTPRRRPFAHGVKFYACSHHGTRPTGHRVIGSYPLDGENRAASWTDYGTVIALLFAKDPHARIGPYKDAGDFRRQVTSAHAGYRKRDSVAFLDLLPAAA